MGFVKARDDNSPVASFITVLARGGGTRLEPWYVSTFLWSAEAWCAGAWQPPSIAFEHDLVTNSDQSITSHNVNLKPNSKR